MNATKNTTKPASSALKTWAEASEKLAHEMADANDVEGAWFLRGVIDALVYGASQEPEAGEYRAQYRRGYNGASA